MLRKGGGRGLVEVVAGCVSVRVWNMRLSCSHWVLSRLSGAWKRELPCLFG